MEAFCPQNDPQIVASGGMSLSAGLFLTVPARLAAGCSGALFIVTSEQPVSVTLRAPGGGLIDPAVAQSTPGMQYGAGAGNFLSMDGFTTMYGLVNPTAGEWQTVITASTPGIVGLYVMVSDTLRLVAGFDKDHYASGNPVRMEAYFYNLATRGIEPSLFISGAINATDGVNTPLTFVDDGTGGDRSAHDYVYTAQFNAPDATGRDPYFPVNLYGATAGTADGTTRYAMHLLVVRPQTARLAPSITEGTRDDDGCGLYEALVLTATVHVSQTGRYRVSGTLADVNGAEIATTLTRYSYDDPPLAVGAQPMPLVFDGQAIRMHGVDGPYHLTNVALSDENSSAVTLELVKDVYYTTTAYAATAFKNPLMAVTGGGELALDTDGNGLIDSLQITVTLNAVNAGEYYWSAALNNSAGRQVGYYRSRAVLTSSSPITLVVPGSDISANGRDGPYVLDDLSVTQASGVGSKSNGVTLTGIAYTTKPYTAKQFEP
jgi:hypothetical protein